MHSLSRTVGLRACVLFFAFRWTATVAQGTISHDAQPYRMTMVNNASLGSDGPWWYISQPIDFPEQYLPMLPAISQTSLVVNASACRSQTAACQLPIPNMWTASGAYAYSGGLRTQSGLVDSSAWDPEYAALLSLDGTGRQIQQRMTMYKDGSTADPTYLDYHTMSVSENYSIRYSATTGYTMNVGFFSLYGAQDTLEYESANGTTVGSNLTLPQAYQKGLAPSMSYGLHIGSVEPNITSSLVLGGYDMSRCLSDPIISGSDTVELRGIAMNVTTGGYAYFNTISAYVPSRLRANGSSISSLEVHLRPGVPHLYLPQDTCDAIAFHLPVTYDNELGLYLWNTDDSTYEEIVSSPHHLDFIFASNDGQERTISVPFALLNLTLTSPIVSNPTQYFPCKPWTPNATGYTLGNAFLQSALLAQNWQTNKLFLAQAPGPDFLSASVQKIGYTDTTLTPAKNPPSWESSWASTLKALPAREGRPDPSIQSDPGEGSSVALSGGAIAGIAVGAIFCLAIVTVLIWFFLRKRRQRRWSESASQAVNSPMLQRSPFEEGVRYLSKSPMELHEVEARPVQVFEMGAESKIQELPTRNGPHQK